MKEINTYILEKLKINKETKLNKIDIIDFNSFKEKYNFKKFDEKSSDNLFHGVYDIDKNLKESFKKSYENLNFEKLKTFFKKYLSNKYRYDIWKEPGDSWLYLNIRIIESEKLNYIPAIIFVINRRENINRITIQIKNEEIVNTNKMAGLLLNYLLNENE